MVKELIELRLSGKHQPNIVYKENYNKMSVEVATPWSKVLYSRKKSSCSSITEESFVEMIAINYALWVDFIVTVRSLLAIWVLEEEKYRGFIVCTKKRSG